MRGACCADAAGETELALANNMALPPHWMDQDIADSIDPKAIATRIGEDREFIKIITKALKSAQDNPRKVGNVGPTDTQRVRMQILKELCKSRGLDQDLDS